MNDVEKKELFAKILKKDRLGRIKSLAEKGNSVCCRVLGEIYFYGIDTNDEYLTELDHAMVLIGCSGIPRIDNYIKDYVDSKFGNYAIICKCTKEPQYEEALKWYTLALEFGEKGVEGNIERIRRILSKSSEESCNCENKKEQIIQIFKINEKEG